MLYARLLDWTLENSKPGIETRAGCKPLAGCTHHDCLAVGKFHLAVQLSRPALVVDELLAAQDCVGRISCLGERLQSLAGDWAAFGVLVY